MQKKTKKHLELLTINVQPIELEENEKWYYICCAFTHPIQGHLIYWQNLAANLIID